MSPHHHHTWMKTSSFLDDSRDYQQCGWQWNLVHYAVADDKVVNTEEVTPDLVNIFLYT